MSANWTEEQLASIAAPDEIRIAPDYADGRSGPLVIVWAVAADGAFYARSARGPQGAWYRRALASGRGRIVVAGREVDVRFEDAAPAVDPDTDQAAIDAAYHAAYDRYGARIVGSVVGPDAHAVTVRITPAD